MKRVGIGADDAALELKQALAEHLEHRGYEVEDYSPPSKEEAQSADIDYPDVAVAVAEAVAKGEHERAILVCGTGIGMSITANKVPGVRAAQCHDVYSAERARKSNDAQVLTMGQRVIGVELAKSVVDAWLSSEFGGAPLLRRLPRCKRWTRGITRRLLKARLQRSAASR